VAFSIFAFLEIIAVKSETWQIFKMNSARNGGRGSGSGVVKWMGRDGSVGQLAEQHLMSYGLLAELPQGLAETPVLSPRFVVKRGYRI
jgi:hypothetical protein